MTRPRGKLLALALIGAAVLVVAGTGAFTTVEAERTVDIGTSDDADALLQLEGNSVITDTEEVAGSQVLTLANSSLNENALTRFDDAVTVTNSGTNDVGFYVTGPAGVGGGEALDIQVNGTSIVGSQNAVDLDVGSPLDVDVVVDLRSPNDVTDLGGIDEITFHADADAHSTA